jgi:hypothetical protein
MKIKFISVILIVFMFGSCALWKKHADLAYQARASILTVDMNSPQVSAGKTEAQFDNPIPFSQLRKSEVEIIYFPLEDAACLKYRIDAYTFYQFWDRSGRETLIKAVQSYNEEFEAQKLIKNRSKTTRNMYGSDQGYLVWQSFSFSVQAKGNMILEVGYYFRKRAPFFAITQGDVLFESVLLSTKKTNSGERLMFLTRAQAAEIAAAFDQGYLRSLAPHLEPAPPSIERNPVDFDTY